MWQSKFSAGFTILELLVVISIIGLLASAILVQFTTVRGRTRDTERESEIKTLQTALALMTIDTRVYPIYTDLVIDGADSLSLDMRAAEVIQGPVRDPLNSGSYQYIYNPTDGDAYTYDGSAYRIRYYLETDTIQGKSAGQQNVTP